MGVVARQWDPVSEIDYCTTCGKIDGLGSAEALIAWGPDVGIRNGDLVVCEYHCKTGRRKAYLKAERSAGHIILRPRCGYPPFFTSPGSRIAANGLGITEIIGVLRGAYLCF